MFSAAKDALASRVARTFLNQRFARYGEMRTLRLDSKARCGEIVCLLRGESEPVSIRIESYALHQRDGGTFVQLGPCSCNRVWLENLLNDVARGREFPLPTWAARVL